MRGWDTMIEPDRDAILAAAAQVLLEDGIASARPPASRPS